MPEYVALLDRLLDAVNELVSISEPYIDKRDALHKRAAERLDGPEDLEEFLSWFTD